MSLCQAYAVCSFVLKTHIHTSPHLFWLPVSGWQQCSPLDSCNWIAVPWCDVLCWWFPGRDTEVEMFPLRLFCIMKLCHTAFALHKSISAMSQVLMVISAPHTQTYDVFVETRQCVLSWRLWWSLSFLLFSSSFYLFCIASHLETKAEKVIFVSFYSFECWLVFIHTFTAYSESSFLKSMSRVKC